MNSARFYDEHAQDFYNRTVDTDLIHLYEPFLALLPPGAHILDAGCGSGRDSLYFKQHGYRVTAMDASAELGKLASQLLGQPVLHLRFQDIAFVDAFDAIWACASLLHVPRGEIDDVFGRLTTALKLGGIFFVSFKYGDVEEVRDDRLFNHYDEQSSAALLARHPQLQLVRRWTSGDARPGREHELWLDLLLRRKGMGRGSDNAKRR